MIICICGKSCSGKSTFAKELVKYLNNAIYIDIDVIAHNILKNKIVKENIKNYFGNNVIMNDEVNRKQLREIVFNNPKMMDKLTDITWPLMEKEVDKIIYKHSNKIIVLDYLLLPKTKYFKIADYKILLNIPYEIRKERALLRDGINEKDFLMREKASIDYNENDYNYILNNNQLNEQIKRQIKEYFNN